MGAAVPDKLLVVHAPEILPAEVVIRRLRMPVVIPMFAIVPRTRFRSLGFQQLDAIAIAHLPKEAGEFDATASSRMT